MKGEYDSCVYEIIDSGVKTFTLVMGRRDARVDVYLGRKGPEAKIEKYSISESEFEKFCNLVHSPEMEQYKFQFNKPLLDSTKEYLSPLHIFYVKGNAVSENYRHYKVQFGEESRCVKDLLGMVSSLLPAHG